MSSFQTHLRALSISRLDDLTTLDDPTFDTRHLVDVAAAAAAAAAPPPLPRRLKASNRVSSKQALVTPKPIDAEADILAPLMSRDCTRMDMGFRGFQIFLHFVDRRVTQIWPFSFF